MGRPSKYPDELRERAVRMVAEVRPQYSSQWAAITAVAGMLGIGTPETFGRDPADSTGSAGHDAGSRVGGHGSSCVGYRPSRGLLTVHLTSSRLVRSMPRRPRSLLTALRTAGTTSSANRLMTSPDSTRYRMYPLTPWTRVSSVSCSTHSAGGPWRNLLPVRLNSPPMLKMRRGFGRRR